jgi:GNAT superfamily N-acetyltransferase
VRELLHSVNKRLGSPYVQIRSTLYRADLADPLPDFELSVPVEVHVASHHEMKGLGRARFPDDRLLAATKAREFVERLTAGDTCLVASVKGQPVSYVWVTYSDWWDPELDFTIVVPEGQCLGYEAYTIPAFRRLGLRQLLQIEERRLGRDRGKSALLFELHGKDAPLAIKKWEPLGLKQQPIAQHTTYKFFHKLKFTKVKELDGGEEGVSGE